MKSGLVKHCLLILGVACVPLVYAYAPVEEASQSYQYKNNPSRPLVPAQQSVNSDYQNDKQRLSMIGRLDDIQNQMRSLRGQVEKQQHQIDQIQLLQREMFADMDNRIRHLSGKPTDNKKADAPKQSKNTTAKPVSDSDILGQQQSYQKAYRFIRDRHYSDAKAALRGYLKQYPNGAYAVNAHYWLGELSLMSGDMPAATTEFNTVINDFPKSQKVADAKLKLGFIAYDKRQWADAKQYLQQVIKQYPHTSASQLAKQRLQMIKREGR